MKNGAKIYPVWAEVDLRAIAHNLNIVKKLVGPSIPIMAVVKANGYGHGAAAVARVADDLRISALGVARISEAITLRKAGLKQPILVFGYTPPNLAKLIIENQLIQTVFSLSYAKSLNHHAYQAGGRIKTHLKVDTGMGRLGLSAGDLDGETIQTQCREDSFYHQVHKIYSYDNLRVDGMYTHFAASDSADKSSAQQQLALFRTAICQLEERGVDIPIKHAANSGAIIELPEAHLDMVRPGVMLYGLSPSDEVICKGFKLQPAMKVKARIAQVKDVPQGFNVSYGHTYTTSEATRLATIPIGYGDGFNRLLSSTGNMLVRGQKAPVVGRVCMDQTVIDVGHINGVCPGDEVVVIGEQEDEVISADDMAQQIGTINYEIVTALMDRVPRVMM